MESKTAIIFICGLIIKTHTQHKRMSFQCMSLNQVAVFTWEIIAKKVNVWMWIWIQIQTRLLSLIQEETCLIFIHILGKSTLSPKILGLSHHTFWRYPDSLLPGLAMQGFF